MTAIKKGIRVFIGIPIIMLGMLLIQIGMQILNVVSPIIFSIRFLGLGKFIEAAGKIVEFFVALITFLFAIMVGIISAPFTSVMFSLEMFWKEGKTLTEMIGKKKGNVKESFLSFSF